MAPDYMLVSGNASPRVTSMHMGLGSYSSKPMSELSDADRSVLSAEPCSAWNLIATFPLTCVLGDTLSKAPWQPPPL